MNTADGETEWSANSWNPNAARGGAWNFFSSTNTCELKDAQSCAKDTRRFRFDKTWRKNKFTEGRRSLKFITERDFLHDERSRVLQSRDIRQFKAGFVLGEW